MATITPTITVGTPALQVSTGPVGIAYSTILESLNGGWAFNIKEIYYRPQSFNQFAYPLGYSIFEINANYKAEMITTFPNPMDFLPVQYVTTKDRKMLFAGQSMLSLKMLASEVVQLFLIGDEIYTTHALNSTNRPDNFKSLAGQMGKSDLFKDYTEEI